jgi:ArsR family transcriptional regulator
VERRLAEALADAPLGHLLDIGTGTGRIAELFADQAARVAALDKNLEMLRVARAKLQHLPAARVELVQGDFAELPFADASFDTVILHQVLHFAPDPAPALAEAARVLRSGGRIAIVDFASHDHEELRIRHQHVRLGFSDRQMADLLRAADFAVATPLALEGGALVVKIWTARRRTPTASAKSPALEAAQ